MRPEGSTLAQSEHITPLGEGCSAAGDDLGSVRVAAVLAVLIGLVPAQSALAAQLVDRNATNVKIAVDSKGEALLTYRTGGVTKHVLVWGAVNALPSNAGSTGSKQVKFRLDYAGGWGKYRTVYWKHFSGSCGAYDGPPLPDVVAACKAPDGSYWAAQSWPQPLPDLGFTPWTAAQRATWLEISHWTGPVAQIETGMDWVYNDRFQQLFGRLLYRGWPVYGYRTTRYGAPTDGFGRLIYLDTYDSVYGAGWRRENSFVTHTSSGAFCYGFYPFDPTHGGYQYPPGQTALRGPGTGTEYRLFAEGPGVTPDVAVTVPGLHPFDARNPQDVALQQEESATLASYGDLLCRAGR